MAAHRYWRVYYLANNTGSYCAIQDIEFRTSVGGPDVTGTGSAISSSVESSTYSADKAFDGNTTTYWKSASTIYVNEWIGYDFGSGNEKDIVEVAATTGTSHSLQAPLRGMIQYSDDGVTWSTLFSFWFSTNWTVSQTRILAPPTNSQYLTKEYGYAVVEFPYEQIHQIGVEVLYEPSLTPSTTRITQAGIETIVSGNGSSRISMSGLSYVYSDYINFFGTPSMTNINSYSMVLSYKYKIYNVSGSLSSSDHVYLVDKDNETDILGSGIIKLYENSYITIIEKTGNWKNPNAKVIGSSGYGYLSPVD